MPDDSPATDRSQRPGAWRSIAAATVTGAVLASLAELGIRVLLPWITSSGLRNINPYLAWLSPLAHASLLLPLMVVSALMVRRSPANRDRILLTVAFCYAATQTALLQSRVVAVAAIALGLGMGVALGRLSERPSWRTAFRGVSVATASLMVMWALALPFAWWRMGRTAIAAGAMPPEGSPNVLLLILDTVGAREMGLYGYDRRTTPVIDSIARRGVTFDRAIASAPWTLPSHASMFTGVTASKLSGRFQAPLDDAHPVIAEAFGAAGYATAGFVANVEYAARSSGLARGFQHYEDHVPSLASAVLSTGIGRLFARQVRSLGFRPLAPSRKAAGDVNASFLNWQSRHDERPWFAFLNYYDAHDPYVPPVGEEERFLAQGPKPSYYLEEERAASTEEIASARALHDAALFFLDRAVGALLAELNSRGTLRNTVVVITADHGEEWGEHGLVYHGNSLYLPVLHVPLVVVHDGVVPAGARVRSTVDLRRLGATLLSLARLPHAAFGASLTLEWTDPERAAKEAGIGVLSWVEQTRNRPMWFPSAKSELFSLVDDSTQVILGSEVEAYNFARDPGLLRNIAGDSTTAAKVRYLRSVSTDSAGQSTATRQP
jgi:arylsulfatase A-like enzyme